MSQYLRDFYLVTETFWKIVNQLQKGKPGSAPVCADPGELTTNPRGVKFNGTLLGAPEPGFLKTWVSIADVTEPVKVKC